MCFLINYNLRWKNITEKKYILIFLFSSSMTLFFLSWHDSNHADKKNHGGHQKEEEASISAPPAFIMTI